MQIGKFREARMIRQPGRMGSGGSMEGQRLIFLYPMLCDQKLFRLLNDFRDFLAVSYIGEIKISNALNITSDSYRNVGAIGQGNNAINPAQMVRQAIWSDQGMSHSSQPDTWTNSENRALYQDKINQSNYFLQNQIKHDPRYSKLKPVVSSITIENLINIPLIIGTYSYQIDQKYLYMILLIAMIYSIPLDSSSNVKRIFNLIDVADKDTLLLSITDPEYRNQIHKFIGYDPNIDNSTGMSRTDRLQNIHKSTKTKTKRKWLNIKAKGIGKIVQKNTYELNQTSLRKLSGWMNTERSKASLFFDLVLDINKWSAVNGHLETRNNLNINKITISSSIQSKHYDRAISSFQHYVENCIIPILHSLDILAGPSYGGVSISLKIEQFINDVTDDLSSNYEVISQMIVNEIQNHHSDELAMKNQINRIINLCKENVDIGSATKSILNNLDSYIHLPPSLDGSDLNQFYTTVVKTADQLNARQKVLDEWIKSITNTDAGVQLPNLIREVVGKYHNIVRKLLFENYPKGSPNGGAWLQSGINQPASFAQRYTNFAVGVLDYTQATNNKSSNLNEVVTQRAINEFYKMLTEIQLSIVKLLSFFFQWNFFSYTCSYMNDVEIDVEIKRRDALEFPNYCLILPLKLFEGLYMTKIISNFDQIMSKQKSNYSIQDIDNQGGILPNISDVSRLIKLVNEQLKIPNIILVDEKTNVCYYKFMYMSKPVKVSLSAMKSYIKHQKDVLPGF